MASIKLRFKAHTDNGKKGALYFQIIHRREVRQVKTCCRIYASEWDERNGCVVKTSPVSDRREDELMVVRERLAWERRKLGRVLDTLESAGTAYTAKDVINLYKKRLSDHNSVFEYAKRQSERQQELGRVRTSETYQQALNSFRRFRENIDLHFDMLTADLMGQYESYLRAKGLTRNTTSFYIRILRCIYNRAVEEGLAKQTDPFKRVYTGVDKTPKRALTLKEIKRIKDLDLTAHPGLEYARDMFLFSFYMRGMSFIDIAYLKKKDLSNGYVSYIRKKTGQQICVRWEHSMQEIVDKYSRHPSPYMLPIITRQDGTERQQYLSKILFVNRKLKQVAMMAKIAIPLSMYVSRHSWASIAKSKNVPLSVISEGLGHDNEETTRIYLAAIQANQIDKANNSILKEL